MASSPSMQRNIPRLGNRVFPTLYFLQAVGGSISSGPLFTSTLCASRVARVTLTTASRSSPRSSSSSTFASTLTSNPIFLHRRCYSSTTTPASPSASPSALASAPPTPSPTSPASASASAASRGPAKIKMAPSKSALEFLDFVNASPTRTLPFFLPLTIS